MATDNVFKQRRERAARFQEEFERYLEALAVVEAFEAKHPEIASDRRAEPSSAKKAPAETPEEAAPAVAPTVAEEGLRGPNMQETVFNAACASPSGAVFEPADTMGILERDAPMAVAVYEIDEKKVRDTLGRLAKDSSRRIRRVRAGARGPNGRPPAFVRDDVDAGSATAEPPAEPPAAPQATPPRVERATMETYAEVYLDAVGPPARSTNDLIVGMTELGWSTEAKDPYTSVFGTLRRKVGMPESVLTKESGGKWGLRKWADKPAGAKEEDAPSREITVVQPTTVHVVETLDFEEAEDDGEPADSQSKGRGISLKPSGFEDEDEE